VFEDEEGRPDYHPQNDVQVNAQKFVDAFDEETCFAIVDLLNTKEEEADIRVAVAS